MKFKLDTPVSSNPIMHYKYPVVAIGSCFADRMAEKLKEVRFDVLANPLGVLYNPISIVDGLMNAPKSVPNEDSLLEANGLWHSWNHHGAFSMPSKEQLVQKIQESNALITKYLHGPKTQIIITLGSAYVYTYHGAVVANCHKVPATNFEKRLLSVEEVEQSLTGLIEEYPMHDFVFTISPVRYIRDGLHESNISKSVLHLGLNKLVSKYTNCHYFPAYEILIDELRDYRFYDSDLVHPNEIAIQYIWEMFSNQWFDNVSKDMLQQWSKIKRMMNHRLLHPDTEEAKTFTANLEKQKAAFEASYF